MTAIKIAANFAALMSKAATGASTAADAARCEYRARKADEVSAYLSVGSMYGSPVTLAEAQKAAVIAWGSEIPGEIESALK
jgi:hypothetical protein